MRVPPAAALVVCLVAAPAAADSSRPFDGFKTFANADSLKPFARDLGGILGGGTFHNGRSLGLTGFDVGFSYAGQFYPEKADAVMRDNGVRAFGLPWIQAEIGLPLNISGFIRGVSSQGLTVSGGGLRYGVYAPSDKPWTPQVLLTGVGHSIVHQDFSASHFGANLVCSAGTVGFLPYAGVGFDRTRLVVRSALLDPGLNGTNVSVLESRLTAGVRLKPFEFTYLSAAYVFAHGQSGAEAALGVRF